MKALIIGVLSFLATLILPWYIPFLIAFLVGLILSNKGGNNFFAGFFGVGIFWLTMALLLDIGDKQFFSSKVASIFASNLNADITSGVLVIITGFLGALLGGLACWFASMITHNSQTKYQRVHKGKYKINLQ
ncbi:MAG: hypothetical protein H6553_12310 [Chitinophagales bacterium]|nr:hypothetical protein [Chitinophagales bacterium]